jgi:hypothetical protein
MKLKIALVTAVCLAAAGCASSSNDIKSGYVTGEVRDTYLKDLDDTQAIDLFKSVSAQKVSGKDDTLAKDITVTALIKALGTRKSSQIKDSGVLDTKHDKVDIKKWTDDEVVAFYNKMYEKIFAPGDNDAALTPGGGSAYWAVSSGEDLSGKRDTSTEADKNTADPLSIIRLTGLYSAGNEISRRENSSGGWGTVKDVSLTTASVAAQIALTLAKFLI